jgi:hypothetical protein
MIVANLTKPVSALYMFMIYYNFIDMEAVMYNTLFLANTLWCVYCIYVIIIIIF